jgi:uncharacterized protein YbjT (DUF2867 family)
MRIAVAGGTGTAGRYTVEAAEKAGHQTVVLSRRQGVDLTTGTGLDAALEGVDIIVDAANSPSVKQEKAEHFFTEVARRLQRSGAEHGASRLIVLSIVGLERVPYGYYQAKLAHETAAREGPLPVTVLRATQFHEFAGQILLRTRLGPVALAPRMVIQPIAARTVGEILVEVATQPDVSGCVEVAGPQREYLPDLAQLTAHRQGRRVTVLPFSLPGKAGEAMRSGGQLPTGEVRVAGPDFDEWLEGTDPLRIRR